MEPTRRSAWSWWLLALAALVTALPVTSAATSALRVLGVLEVVADRDAGTFGFFDERGLRVAEGISLLLTLPVAIACGVVLIGLALQREWAREGALGVFGLSGLLLLVFSVNGLTQDPPGEHAGLGLLASLVVLAVAALTVSPGVRRDFEQRVIAQQVREREAAAAARRARSGT